MIKKINYVLLVILVITALIRCCYEYRIHKEAVDHKVRYEKHHMDVIRKGGQKVREVDSLEALEHEFYTKLKTCEPVNVEFGNEDNFVIYGVRNNTCVFEKYSPVFNIQCSLPKELAKQYALSAEGDHELVNKINYDSKYCMTLLGENFKLQQSKSAEKLNKKKAKEIAKDKKTKNRKTKARRSSN